MSVPECPGGTDVTIAVTYYDAPLFLFRRCLDSILSQTFSAFELLVLTDGSPQDLSALTEEYLARDERIRFLMSDVNHGVSWQRNRAIDEAKGKYLMFVDGDDEIAPGMLQTLLNGIADADIAMCATGRQDFEMREGTYDARDFFSDPQEFTKIQYINFSVNKLYKIGMLRENGLRYPEGTALGEDALFLSQVLSLCKRIFVSNEPLYLYTPNPASLTRTYHAAFGEWELALVDAQWEMFHRYPLASEDSVFITGWLFRKLRDILLYYDERKDICGRDDLDRMFDAFRASDIHRKFSRLEVPEALGLNFFEVREWHLLQKDPRALFEDFHKTRLQDRVYGVVKHFAKDPKGTTETLYRTYHLDKAVMRRSGRVSFFPGEYERDLKTKEMREKGEKGDIVVFSGVPYFETGGGQRYAQLIKTFDRMGYRTHLVYAFDASKSNRDDIENPCATHVRLDRITTDYLASRMTNPRLFIFEIPYRPLLTYVMYAEEHGIPTVYEHIDNWETSLGEAFYDEATYRAFLMRMTAITAVSRALITQMADYTDRTVHHSPNAVDTKLFAADNELPCPADLVKGRDKTLVYHGSLWGEWFDWELLCDTAKGCPDSAFNLIGDDAMLTERKKTLPANIHFPGLKKQSDLPAYLQHADIAFIPFDVSEIGMYVSPLKIFEYIAMGKRVLSTPMPDIEGYPNTVTGDTAKEWISEILSERDVAPYRDFAKAHSWTARCEQLLSLTDQI